MRVPASWLLGAMLLAACGGGGGDGDTAATPENMVRVPTITGAVPEAAADGQFDPSQIEVTHEWLPSDSATGDPVVLRLHLQEADVRTSHMATEVTFQMFPGGSKDPLQSAQARGESAGRLEVLEAIGEDRWRIQETHDVTLDQVNTSGTWTDTGDADEPPGVAINVIDSLRRYSEFEVPEGEGAVRLRGHLLARVEGVLPSAEARVGDRWRATARHGQSNATALHTLSAVAPDPDSGDLLATITSDSSVTVVGPITVPDDTPGSPFASLTTNSLTDASTRTVTWNVTQGRPVRMQFESQSTVDVVAVPRATESEGVLVPILTRIQRQGHVDHGGE